MSPAVKNARTTLDKAQAEVRRVADAIEIHTERLEGLKAGLVPPPDRAGELAELLAAVALGEATEKDVAALRAIIAKEAESSSKRNASDLARIAELEAQLAGLRSRLERAQDAEQQGHRALRGAVVAEFQANAEQHSKELVKALHATSAAYEKLAATCMALDSVDSVGRMNLLIGAVKLDLSGNWPLPGPTYEELFVLSTSEARQRAFQRYQETVGDLEAIGVDVRELRS